MIYVLFGPPGVGKTYVGKLLSLQKKVGFFDADNLLDETERVLIRKGEYNLDARIIFFEKLIKYLGDIYPSKFENLVVAQAFTQEKNRIQFMNSLKNRVKFIRVVCSKGITQKRIKSRFNVENHVISPQVFDTIWGEFEEPKIAHSVVINEGNTDESLLSQLDTIMELEN
jgi:gluconate kinase